MQVLRSLSFLSRTDDKMMLTAVSFQMMTMIGSLWHCWFEIWSPGWSSIAKTLLEYWHLSSCRWCPARCTVILVATMDLILHRMLVLCHQESQSHTFPDMTTNHDHYREWHHQTTVPECRSAMAPNTDSQGWHSLVSMYKIFHSILALKMKGSDLPQVSSPFGIRTVSGWCSSIETGPCRMKPSLPGGHRTFVENHRHNIQLHWRNQSVDRQMFQLLR